jgi:nitrogen fixation NifU-like protein
MTNSLSTHKHRPYTARERPGKDAMNDEEQVYQEHVLDHFEDPYHRGHCPGATHAHEDDNPLCGDVVHVELEIAPEGRLRQAWFEGEGCCISQASASMLMQEVEGRSLAEIKAFTANDMLQLFGAKLTPNRQKCCLLPWRVLQAALYSPIQPGRESS